VEVLQCGRTIHRHPNEVSPVEFRETFGRFPVSWAVQGVDLLEVPDSSHQQADGLSTGSLVEHRRRPGSYLEQLVSRQAEHGAQFGLLLGGRSIVVDLGH
jgi:hypothetical protein